MFEKVWGLSNDLRTAVTLWKVDDKRFIRPTSEEKPPKEVKVVGNHSKLKYIGTNLNCDIYEGDMSNLLQEDYNVPQDVLDYMNYMNRSRIILLQIGEKVNEIIQESRSISEASKGVEESDGETSSSENGPEC